MPERPPSVIRSLIQAQDHPHLHLPRDVIDALPETKRGAVNQRIRTIEALRTEKSAIVTRVGKKIGRIREKLLPEGRERDFVKFRIAGSTEHHDGDGNLMPAEEFQIDGFSAGGVFGQPEDQREAFVDAVLAREGL